jgi:hypothetical protein
MNDLLVFCVASVIVYLAIMAKTPSMISMPPEALDALNKMRIMISLWFAFMFSLTGAILETSETERIVCFVIFIAVITTGCSLSRYMFIKSTSTIS